VPAHRKKEAPEGCYWRGEVLWARFTVGGKEYRFSLKTGDPAVARNRAAAEHAKIVAAHSFGEDRKLWADAVTAWGQYMVSQVGARTFDRYTNSLDIIDDHLTGLHVDEVSDDTVAAIVRARRAAGVSTATIRRDLTALSSVLGFAVDEKWRKGNPALEAMRSRRLKERRDPIVLPEDRDIERVIARAPGLFAHLIRAALLTGCRQDELVTLERRHVDLSRRAISVLGKGNKRREVGLTDEAVALFASIPVNLATRAVFWHPGAKGLPGGRAREEPEPGPFINPATRFSLIYAQRRSGRGGGDREGGQAREEARAHLPALPVPRPPAPLRGRLPAVGVRRDLHPAAGDGPHEHQGHGAVPGLPDPRGAGAGEGHACTKHGTGASVSRLDRRLKHCYGCGIEDRRGFRPLVL
jgi:integrase/recombinase XerD